MDPTLYFGVKIMRDAHGIILIDYYEKKGIVFSEGQQPLKFVQRARRLNNKIKLMRDSHAIILIDYFEREKTCCILSSICDNG